MSVETTMRNFQGEWKFKGKTNFDFDELDVSIGEEVLLIFKFRGEETKRKKFKGSGAFVGEYLIFNSIDNPRHFPFFVIDATLEDMICGQQKSSIVGETEWYVKANRK